MRRILGVLLLVVIVIGVFTRVIHKSSDSQTASFNKNQYSLSNPSSIWVIVNKQRPLTPLDYKPDDLHNVGFGQKMTNKSAKDLIAMMVAAKKDKVELTFESGYRSYEAQQKAYQSIVNGFSQSVADKESARPGYSEHQTGLAMDFGNDDCKVHDCFTTTKEGKWLATNSYKYGFIMRYPADKQAITGYKEEAWHYRYVGKPLALELHKKRISTLEEYFAIAGGGQYK